jgi:hypothetical protein
MMHNHDSTNREIEQRAMIGDLESLLQQSENRRERLAAALGRTLDWADHAVIELNNPVFQERLHWRDLETARAVLAADGKP